MIWGIGIDMVDINRIEEKVRDREGFKKLVFSEREKIHCEKKANSDESYAARFAAKEAFLKALKTGFNTTFELNQIEILNDEQDAPYMVLSDEIQKIIKKKTRYNNIKIHVSLSHTKDMASAMVLLEIF